MLLTPYRNPPYRMPTLDRSASTNGANVTKESPKRKRVPSFPASLSIDTSGTGSDFGLDPDVCDSPRSKVAQRLSQLELKPEIDDVPRKRSRTRRWIPGDVDVEGGAQTPMAVKTTFTAELDELPDQELEIAETPDCRAGTTRSPTPSPMVIIPTIETPSPANPSPQPKSSPKRSPAKRSPTKRLRSPTPPTPTPPNDSVTPSPQPTSKTTNNNPPTNPSPCHPSAFPQTWQPTEITPQTISPTAPDDDDGEGINGVGFRPTPSMAYARSQKRKQQVSEWKAREAREARQRRFQKRQQGGCGGDGEGDGGGCGERGREGRVVRFASDVM